MKSINILKLGGSVITYKNSHILKVRKKLIIKIGENLKDSQNIKPQNLILIHGAGSFGHQIAKKYHLQDGIKNQPEKWPAVIQTKLLCQKLNSEILNLLNQNLPIFPIQTSSVIINKNKIISKFNLKPIQFALKNNLIPLLYGDMVFDEKLDASICSGDTIAAYLAKKLNINKIFFASDIDGVYNDDPFKNPRAKLIKEINITSLINNHSISESHHTDVTGGLKGKLGEFFDIKKFPSLQEIIIFNGLREKNYYQILTNNNIKCTRIFL